MTKNRYEVTGVDSKGEQFFGTCIAYDIVSAIQLFRDSGYSAHTVQSRIQVCKDEKIKIEDVQYYKYDRYATYKAIMKHHLNAIDGIHTLEEAKDIISMIAGNVYLNGEIYQMMNEYPNKLYKELLQSKGFELNTYPEGKFWELEIKDDEERKVRICKAFQADIELFDASNISDIDTLILQCAEDFTKCLLFYDCNSWDMETEEFMKCVEKI